MVGAQDESIAGFFSMGKPEPVDFRGKGFGRSLALCRAQSIVPSSKAESSSWVKKSAGLWRRSVERSRSPAVDTSGFRTGGVQFLEFNLI